MTTYRKKPVEINAIQFTGDNIHEIWDAFGAAGIYGPTEKNPDHLILTTVHGDEAPARPGDWIIPDGKPGTFYPCKPDIFAETYEPAVVSAPVQPTTRADVLNAAALHLYTVLFPAVYEDLGQKAAEGVNRAVSELRRMAGEEQPTTETRPRCPHCRLPHDLTPGSMAVRACASISASIAKAEQLHAEGDHHLCAAVACETVRDLRARQDGATT